MKSHEAKFATLIVVAGVAIRMWHFLANRGLFIDEARLALNIGLRSWTALFQPMWLEQVAPVPFLLLVNASVELFGMHEMSLRLVSLAAGCALLPIMWRLASRLLQQSSALLALALVAFSPGMIRASTDAKPYSSDVFIAVCLLLVGLRVIDEAASMRSIVAATCTSIIAVAFSFTAAMVAAVVLLVVGALAVQQRDWRRIAVVGVGGAMTLIVVAIPYVALYRLVGDSPYMQEFWAEAFLTGRPGHDVLLVMAFVWGWIGGNISPMVRDTGVQVVLRVGTILVLLAAFNGLRLLARSKGWSKASLVAGPIIIFTILNALRAYPSVLRLELFIVPVVAILASGGAVMPADARGRRVWLWISAVPVGGILGVMLASSLIPRYWPYYWQELSSVVSAVPDSARVVYVNAGALPGWAYYTTDWTAPNLPRLRWLIGSMSVDGPAFENATALAAPDAIKTLRRVEAGRVEVLGARTGARIRPYDTVRTTPHPGWASAEAERLMGEAAPDAWLVFTNHRLLEGSFIDALEDAGASIENTITADGAAVLHVQLRKH